MKNYYAALGVAPCASKEEIRARYYELARTLHPDAGGDLYQFAPIAHAYRVLTDADERLAHDRALALVMNPCAKCGGMGRVRRSLTFTDTELLPCPVCHEEGYFAR